MSHLQLCAPCFNYNLDLGDSFIFGEPALKLILQRMPATLELACFSLFISLLVAIPLGIYAGYKPDSKVSKTIMAGSILGFSMPTFWVGIIFIMIFGFKLKNNITAEFWIQYLIIFF